MSEPQLEPKPETAIAKRPIEMGHDGFELRTLDDAWRFATAVAKSKLAPKGYEKPEDVLIAIQHGAEIGLKPMQALSSIAVIQGRPCLFGDGIPALLWGSGLLLDLVEVVEGLGDGMVAKCTMRRKGAESAIVRTFSVQDAKAASLWGKQGPWSQYPKRMLQMRARSWAARDGFADVLRGLQIREEWADVPPERTERRQTVTLTPDGRLEPETPPAPAEAATDVVETELQPLANESGELF